MIREFHVRNPIILFSPTFSADAKRRSHSSRQHLTAFDKKTFLTKMHVLAHGKRQAGRDREIELARAFQGQKAARPRSAVTWLVTHHDVLAAFNLQARTHKSWLAPSSLYFLFVYITRFLEQTTHFHRIHQPSNHQFVAMATLHCTYTSRLAEEETLAWLRQQSKTAHPRFKELHEL